MKRRFLIVLPLILLAGGYALFSPSRRMETVYPHRGSAVQAVYATGEVEPVEWAELSAKVAGQVVSLKVDEGDTVKAGDVLAELDDSVERAELVEHRARISFLAREMERYRKLMKMDFASRQRYEQAQSEYNAVTAAAKAQESLIERMHIRSPLDGVVLRREIEQGESVKQNDPVFWVGMPRPLWITAEVEEEDIPLVRPGQKVLIKADAFPGEVLEGSVSEITPKGDPVDKSFRVRVSLPEDTKLLTGMTVETNIVIREVADTLLVPPGSVEESHVWVVTSGMPEKRAVKTGIEGEDATEILEGLKENEEIALHPGGGE